MVSTEVSKYSGLWEATPQWGAPYPSHPLVCIWRGPKEDRARLTLAGTLQRGGRGAEAPPAGLGSPIGLPGVGGATNAAPRGGPVPRG